MQRFADTSERVRSRGHRAIKRSPKSCSEYQSAAAAVPNGRTPEPACCHDICGAHCVVNDKSGDSQAFGTNTGEGSGHVSAVDHDHVSGPDIIEGFVDEEVLSGPCHTV